MQHYKDIIIAIDAVVTFAGDDRETLQNELRLAREYILAIEAKPSEANEAMCAEVARLLYEAADAMDEAGFGFLSRQVTRAAALVEDLPEPDELEIKLVG